MIWLWHESREQIGFLVNETLSAKARNNHVEKEIMTLPRYEPLPGDGQFYPALLIQAVTDNSSAESTAVSPQRIVRRTTSSRCPCDEYEEIGAVTTSLNQLLARARITIHNRKECFTARARTHELRPRSPGSGCIWN